MHTTHTLQVIAHIRSDFPTKFGIPRQSGLAETRSAIVFEPEFRQPDALRGLDGFSHLWLLWQFSAVAEQNRKWSPTVRPPRLGGNRRMGVFATRSPFRPNPIGLSCVKLDGIETRGKDGTVLIVSGADLMDGSPIYDIKPYLPFTDAHPEASSGFTHPDTLLNVIFPEELLVLVSPSKRDGLISVLAQDPRPAYQEDPQRIYGFTFAGMEIRFRVSGNDLTVLEIHPL